MDISGMADNKFTIEHVVVPDERIIKEVIAIQKDLAIADNLLTAGKRIAEEGLLISNYSVEELAAFINEGGSLFVARRLSSGDAIGYLFQTAPQYFTPKFIAADVEWLDDTLKDKYEKVILDNNYVYLNQIGVLFDFHRSGASAELMRAYEHKFGDKLAVAIRLRSPIENVRSLAFFTKHGYSAVATLAMSKRDKIKYGISDLLVKGPHSGA